MKNITILSFLFLLISSCNFAPGSYPYVEEYTINLSEEKLIDVIKIFKKNNPKYMTPYKFGLQDGRRTMEDHWYHIYFHYPNENKIIKTWIRKRSKTETIFAFVAIKQYLGVSSWNFINKDLKKNKNKEEIKEFENKILYKMGVDDFIKN